MTNAFLPLIVLATHYSYLRFSLTLRGLLSTKVLMLISLFIQILGFIEIPYARAQVIYPQQKIEYVRHTKIPVYSTQDILNPKPEPIEYLKQNQKLLPCILIDSNKNPFKKVDGKFYLGFELLDSSHSSFFQSVENNHCPMWFAKMVKDSDLTASTPAKSISTKRIIRPPAVKDWLTKKMARLQKNKFKKPEYYTDKRPIDLSYEFHNTQCPGVNKKVENRGNRLKQKWNQFIKEKAKVSEKAGFLALQAKNTDLVTRTALYESNYSYGCSAKSSCEKQIIALTIYNRAQSNKCKNGNTVWGCKYKGDYSGVATKPNQYNIWFKKFPVISHLTGCFLREDLQVDNNNPAIWKDSEGNINEGLANGYRKRIAMYKDSFAFNQNFLFNQNTSLKDYFKIHEADNSKLSLVRFYYHPAAMPRCEHKTYSSSAWVTTSYVKKDSDNYFLLRRNRIFPNDKQDIQEDQQEESSVSFYLYKTASGKISDIYPEGQIPSSNIDYTHGSLCTAYGVSPSCQYKEPIKSYKKMPKWLLSGTTPKISCLQTTSRGLECDENFRREEFTKSFGGACNTQFLPVSQIFFENLSLKDEEYLANKDEDENEDEE